MAEPATGSLKERLRSDRGRVWIVGHRGAMGYCPENTMVSFERALELGADWIELDVHLTKDGELAVIHDETLDRTTNGSGFVKDYTLAEVQAFDAGTPFGAEFAGQHVPSLDEVLVWARQRDALVDIEIKNAPLYYQGIEDAVVRCLDERGMTERSIVISFDHAAVKRVKELDERVATGVLFAGRPVDGGVELARQANADALLPHWAYVTRQDVDHAHQANLAVAPWVSSDPLVLQQLIGAGVDAIGTNHPDVLKGVLEGQRR